MTASPQPSLPEPHGSPTLGAPGLAVARTTEKVGPYCSYLAQSLQGISLRLQLQLQSGSGTGGAVRELPGIPA